MKTARLLPMVAVTVLLFASVPVGAQQPVAPPPPQIPYGAPIGLELAKKVIAGAEAEARKNNWNMVIAVLDSGGHLVMLDRMDVVSRRAVCAAAAFGVSAVAAGGDSFQVFIRVGIATFFSSSLEREPARPIAPRTMLWNTPSALAPPLLPVL